MEDISKIDVNNLTEDELNDLLPALEELAVTTPLDYIPHPKQLKFHCAPNKFRLVCGGNRSGKTEMGTVEDAMHSSGIYPDWYPKELQFTGPTEGRVIVTDYAKGAMNFEKKLFKWLPKDRIVDIKRTNKGGLEKVTVKHSSGGISIIEILTHEQDTDVFEGWSGHWAHFDEPPPRDKFIATARGLIDFKGRCWLTLTPINEPWLYDEFVHETTTDVYYDSVDINDNPYLPKEEIAQFEALLTEDEKEARLRGKFRHLAGVIYKEFDPLIHVIEKYPKLNSSCPVFFICDPHDRKPHFGLWATVDPRGTLYIINEIKFQGTIKEFSMEVLRQEIIEKYPSSSIIRILDPNKGETPTAVTGIKLKDEFAKWGLYFITSVNDDIAMGHLAVSEKLLWNKKKPLDATNHPKLYFIKDKTKGCISYIQRYTWDDWKSDQRTPKEKPKDNYKDFPDCLRYFVMFNPQFYILDESDIARERPKIHLKS